MITLGMVSARAVAVGGPAINFDFTRGSLPGGTTFTRSTTGHYFNSSGVFTSAAIDAPRFEYDPATLAGPYLLYEPQRTNLALQSSGASGWTIGALTNTAGITGPDGITPLRLLTATSSANKVFYQSQGRTGTYTSSIYAKAGTHGYVYINIQGGAGAHCCAVFDLLLGAVGQTSVGTSSTLVGTSIQHIGGGVYRCSMTSTLSGTFLLFGFAQGATGNTFATSGQISNATTSTGTLYLGSIQHELGATAASYIPTTAASATRGTDTHSFTIPSGVSQLTYTFDDNTTQNVSVSPGAYSVPNTLNRWGINSIVSDV